MTKNKRTLLFLILASLSGGAIAPLAKLALQEIPPFTLTLIRIFAALPITFLAFKWIGHHNFQWKNLGKLWWLLLLGTANIVLFIIGLQYTTSIVGQMLYTTCPFITAIFSYFLLNEKLAPQKIFGILVGLAGALGIILMPTLKNNVAFTGTLFGNLMIFTAVVCFSLYAIYSQKFQKQYSPLELTTYFGVFIFFFQIFISPIEIQTYPSWWTKVSYIGILSAIATGITGGLHYLFHQYLIQQTNAVISTMFLYLQPIVTIIIASMLLGEKITLAFIIGAILVFAGVWLTTYSVKSKQL